MKCSYLGILLLLMIKLNAQDAFVAYGMYPKKSGDVRLFANYYRSNVDFFASSSTEFLSYYPSIIYGLNNQVNVGLRLKYRQVRFVEHFEFQIPDLENNTYYRNMFTACEFILRNSLGAKFKHFSLNHSLSLPLGRDLSGQNGKDYIDWNGIGWTSEIYYSNYYKRLQIFSSLGIQFENIERSVFRKNQSSYLVIGIPVSFLPGIKINEKHFVYLLSQATIIRWSISKNYYNNQVHRSTFADAYYQIGIGYKWFILPQFEIEPIATLFFDNPDKSTKAYTLNLGLRYYLNK
ncbi:MAG: hypothetical protein IPG55_08030 [Saprospiraceae bacterium]|nr:hypothetical protein [Candidatus Defluviibacterium haderslevense]